MNTESEIKILPNTVDNNYQPNEGPPCKYLTGVYWFF